MGPAKFRAYNLHMPNASDKGRQLEDAVLLIEQTILETFPGYRNDVFTIES
jgi:hypothetical protein